MKLYNLDIGDKFILAGDPNSPVFTFHRLDGMYSICYTNNLDVYTLGSSAPVLRIEEKKCECTCNCD